MGIIGVVAALTLPNLNSSTGHKEKVTKVKKAYQNLSDALGRAQAVYGPLSEWKVNDSSSEAPSTMFGERLTEFMKVSKSCGVYVAGCCANNYKSLDGEASDALCVSDMYTFILADGMNIATYYWSGGGYSGYIYVDIDGPNKGPNTWGKDIFEFIIVNGELYPAGYDLTTDASIKDACFGWGGRCANWVIQNENMDYLKCPDKLSLTNTTCK